MKVADITAGLLGVLLGLWVLWRSANMPVDLVMKIGPGFFPSILAGGLIVFSAALVFKAVRSQFKGRVEARSWSDVGLIRGLITGAAAIAFVAVMEPLGFVPTSIVFLTFMMWVMGKRTPLLMALVPSLVTVAIWLVFEKLLHLSMPPGVLDGLI